MPSVFGFLTGKKSWDFWGKKTDEAAKNGPSQAPPIPASKSVATPVVSNSARSIERSSSVAPPAPVIKPRPRPQQPKVDRKKLVEHIISEEYYDFDDDYVRGREIGKFKYGSLSYVTSRISHDRFLCKTFIKKRHILVKEDVQAVREEHEALQALKGETSIAQLITVYEDSDYVHFIKEMCTGEELLDLLVKSNTYSEQQAAKFFSSIVKIVQICHREGVMLRSLKVESFRYSAKQELKLVDTSNAVILPPGKKLKDILGDSRYIAPEVLQRRYSKEADIWCLGIILHVLLLGSPPFSGESDAEIFEKILSGFHHSKLPEWFSLSMDARDLVEKILMSRPHERLSLDKILAHPWISTGGSSHLGSLHTSVITGLQNFSKSSKLQRAVCQVLADRVPKDQLKLLKQQFAVIDKNGSGTITYSELRKGLKDGGMQLTEAQLEQFLDAIDKDKDGIIDYQEFINAMSHTETGYNASDLARAFDHFDADGNGILTKQELARALEEYYDLEEQEIREIIRMADTDGNGTIDFDEFVAVMQQSQGVTD